MIIDIVTVALKVDQNLFRTIESVNRLKKFLNINIHHIFVLADARKSELIRSKYKKTIIIQNARGIYSAFNLALTQVTGQYTIFLNSGDTFYDSQIMKLFDFKKDNFDGKILIGNFVINTGSTKFLNQLNRITVEDIFLKKTVLNHQSIFYPNEIFLKHKFEVKYKIAGDFAFNLNAIKEFNYRKINKTICLVDTNGISNSKRYLSNFEDFLIRVNFMKVNKYWKRFHWVIIILGRDLFSSTLYYLFKILSKYYILNINSDSKMKIKLFRFFGNRNEIITID